MRSKAALLRAIRAAVVLGALFALSDKVIGNLQVATFAAFGTFATLVLASFGGTRRDKLIAHGALALAGSALLAIGTAVHSPTALAALATVPVTFIVFFAGITGPNAASGATAALLAYVLPAASAGTNAMIPDRLAGWWLASVVGTAAVLLMSPRGGGDQLRTSASGLATALADQIDAALAGGGAAEHQTVLDRKHELLERWGGAPLRPTGLAAADQAFAASVELLEWCGSLVTDAIGERLDLIDAAPPDRALLAGAASVLREVAALLCGSRTEPDLDGLAQLRDASLARLSALPPGGSGFRESAQVSFHANSIAFAVIALGTEATVAMRLRTPEWLEFERRRWLVGQTAAVRAAHRVSSVASAARRNATLRSVWFINSLRGAIALAVAVAVADLVGVQHGFWVVLGTLSVLRTNAASTGATALRALTGTAIGFVIGGALLVGIGSDSTALWVALPVAVFVAAYSPGTAPFAVGQAAFTVTVAVIFNLLVPVGWTVGVVRIEDVALGSAVSVAVGTLFWPRGVAAVVGDDLADAFRRGTSYLSQAVAWAIGSRAAEPDGAAAAATAAERLDAALRAWMTEQGTKQLSPQELWRMIGGALRLRWTARSVADFPPDVATGKDGRVLTGRMRTLAGWYDQLAELVGRPNGGRTITLRPATFAPADVVDTASASPYAIWLCEHLEHLAEHTGDLVDPAARIAELRRRPWWR